MKKGKQSQKVEFVKQFQVYKLGRTQHPVTIISPAGQPYPKKEKIAIYKELGYTVYDLAGNII